MILPGNVLTDFDGKPRGPTGFVDGAILRSPAKAWLHVLYVYDNQITIHEYHGQGDCGVEHPKGVKGRLVEIKYHAMVVSQVFFSHQPLLAFFFRVGLCSNDCQARGQEHYFLPGIGLLLCGRPLLMRTCAKEKKSDEESQPTLHLDSPLSWHSVAGIVKRSNAIILLASKNRRLPRRYYAHQYTTEHGYRKRGHDLNVVRFLLISEIVASISIKPLVRLPSGVKGWRVTGRQARTGCLFLLLLVLTFACSRDRDLIGRKWSMIAETENQSLLFIDPTAISYPDSTSVLVWVKYVPSKNRAVAGMRELSKEFGGGTEHDEYTVSQWHFSCVNPASRCLRLVHYRDKTQIASYNYPSGDWTGPPKGDTKLIFDAACGIRSKTAR